VGAELACWISDNAPLREELRAYTLERFRTGDLIFGEHEPGEDPALSYEESQQEEANA
jgi:hypothetical protein